MFDTILWLQTAFIGDILLTSAAIALVRRRRPELTQYIITTAVGKEILHQCPGLDGIIVFEKRGGSTFTAFSQVKREIAARGLTPAGTCILQAHRSLRSTLLARYLGFFTVTYHESSAAWLADYRLPRLAIFHEATRIALLLAPLGFTREELVGCRPQLGAGSEEMGPWGKKLTRLKAEGKTLVALAPGSKWGTKCWPVASYSHLLARLSEHKMLHVLILGSSEEIALGKELIAGLPGATRRGSVENLCGATSIAELKEIFPQLSLLITGDSSPLHFASAYNIPTVAIFGATVPAMGFGPLADRQRVVEHAGKLPCRPCSDHGPQTCPLGHFRCMKEVSVEMVLGASREFIS